MSHWFLTRKFLAASVVLALALGSSVAVSAQIRIVNPGIPDSEDLVYSQKIGDETQTLSEQLRLKNEGGKSFYEIVSHSPRSDVTFTLDAANLSMLSTDQTNRNSDSVIRTTTQVLQTSYVPKSDEILVPDLNSIPFLLRGFPWGTVNYAKIVFLGARDFSGGYTFELWGKGRETLTIAGKKWECWKVELGLSGFLGNFAGKTYFWFSTDPSHVMVRTEGALGGPGSPKRVLELLSYTSGGK